MLGSNPIRDSRLRRGHARGEGGLSCRLPLLIMTLPFMPLKTHKIVGAKRLISKYRENESPASV
jgi:hypothetical protein